MKREIANNDYESIGNAIRIYSIRGYSDKQIIKMLDVDQEEWNEMMKNPFYKRSYEIGKNQIYETIENKAVSLASGIKFFAIWLPPKIYGILIYFLYYRFLSYCSTIFLTISPPTEPHSLEERFPL